MYSIKGIPASEGIAIGSAFLYQPQEIKLPRRTDADPETEWARLQDALLRAEAELRVLRDKLAGESGEEEAKILDAHMLMLNDPALSTQIRTLIDEQSLNAEAALNDAMESQAVMLESLDDEYMAARAADLRDVAQRVTRILLGVETQVLASLDTPAIIVAHDLTPSDTVAMNKKYVLGFCTAVGGPTAHTAILARSMAIPAMVGAGEEIMSIRTGMALILDGGRGELIVEPDQTNIERYQARQREISAQQAAAKEAAHEPAQTRDGHQVEVVANIGDVAEAEAILDFGAEGVGLLRSEFLFLERTSAPTEPEQFEAYSRIAAVMEQRPLIIRTLDVGGDKPLPYLSTEPEENPFLGHRGIRLCLAEPEMFKIQLRAILRAAESHNIKIMFPMVSNIGEIRQAKALLAEAQTELDERGVTYGRPEVGIMVEIPAAAVITDILAGEVDFFSIGTNDLAQYTLAADRTNALVQPLADALHPAVLRLIAQTIRYAHEADIWVGLCGELAGDPLAAPVLLGLGLDEFSMAATSIPTVKETIRKWSLSEAKIVAEQALQQEDAAAVRALLRQSQPQA
jgi:phosphoenolpyruvate-protein phosphotransferase